MARAWGGGSCSTPFAPKLKGHTVKWLSDNQNVVQIIQYDNKKPHLQDGAMSIFEICFQHSIKLVMNWVPRSENEVADYISKLRDFDDWKVNPIIFQCLSKAWGPFTVDCFASELPATAFSYQILCA